MTLLELKKSLKKDLKMNLSEFTTMLGITTTTPSRSWKEKTPLYAEHLLNFLKHMEIGERAEYVHKYTLEN